MLSKVTPAQDRYFESLEVAPRNRQVPGSSRIGIVALGSSDDIKRQAKTTLQWKTACSSRCSHSWNILEALGAVPHNLSNASCLLKALPTQRRASCGGTRHGSDQGRLADRFESAERW